jgi:hypothetical protein
VVAADTPEALVRDGASHTGRALAPVLARAAAAGPPPGEREPVARAATAP